MFLARPSWPLEGCFDAKQRQQGAHGRSSGHSVMHLVRRGDVRAADANLMIKGGHSVAVPAQRTTRLSSLVQRGKLALRAKRTSTVGPPTSYYDQQTDCPCGRWLFCSHCCLYYHGPSPWTAPLRWTRATLPCSYCAYKRRLTTTVAKDREHNYYAHTHAGKTKAAPSSSIVTLL